MITMAWTPITSFNLSTFGGFRDFIVSNSLGVVGTLMLIFIYIVFAYFYWLSSEDIIGGFAVGGFALLVSTVLLAIGGWISLPTILVAIGIFIVSEIGLFIPRD